MGAITLIELTCKQFKGKLVVAKDFYLIFHTIVIKKVFLKTFSRNKVCNPNQHLLITNVREKHLETKNLLLSKFNRRCYPNL